MRHLPIFAALLLVLMLALPSPSAAQTGYLATFDGLGATSPLPFVSYPAEGAVQATDLDLTVHSRNRQTWTGLSPLVVGHGHDCAPPPATHQSNTPHRYEDATFVCRNHLMTSLGESGYGLIYLTPHHLVDFEEGEAVVSFDVSTLRTSGRDWWDIWLTPFEDNLVAPFDTGTVALQGAPRRALQVRMDTFNGQTVFRIRRWDAHELTDLGSCWWCGYEQVLNEAGQPASQSRRDRFELRISKTHVKFWMPSYGITWIDKDIATPLEWGRAVVQIGHHSYTPSKDCTPSWDDPNAPKCVPNTWHWDNIALSRSVPFRAIRANERSADETTAGAPMAFTFPAPAPEGAYLRVNAYGRGYQVSTDDGATWEPLTRQAQAQDKSEHHASYWHPIPAGTEAVKLRTTIWGWWGRGNVDHAAIWAEDGDSIVPPTPTMSPTPTPEPTETPEPTPVATDTPAPTFTPVPSTPAPAAMQARVGVYAGDGSDDRAITVGFQPDAVFIKGGANEWVIRSSSMTGDATKQGATAAELAANMIQSLTATGFVVGTDARVNASGTTYYYLALKDNGSGSFATGSYTGNGVDSTNITNVGFAPQAVIYLPAASVAPGWNLGGTDSTNRAADSFSGANLIQAFGDGTFQVGSGSANTNGGAYHYLAFRDVAGFVDIGSYTGNGSDGRSITGAGFDPAFVLVQKRTATYRHAALRFKDNAGDDSVTVNAAASTTDIIQALISDGFEIGTANNVNTSSATYDYLAIKETP